MFAIRSIEQEVNNMIKEAEEQQKRQRREQRMEEIFVYGLLTITVVCFLGFCAWMVYMPFKFATPEEIAAKRAVCAKVGLQSEILYNKFNHKMLDVRCFEPAPAK